MKNTKKIVVSLLLAAVVVTATPTAALAQSINNAAILQQIQLLLELIGQLQKQLTALQAVAPVNKVNQQDRYTSTPISGEVDGETTITLLAPVNERFDKSNPLMDVVTFRWQADNVPSDQYVVEIQHERIRDFDYSGPLSGSTWEGTLPTGDSVGRWGLDISQIGSTDAGIYRAQARVYECIGDPCNSKRRTLVATSRWVQFTITDSRAGRVTRERTDPLSVRLAVNALDTYRHEVTPEKYDEEIEATINLSKGYVSNCIVEGRYESEIIKDTLQFNQNVDPKKNTSFGRMYFAPITKYGALERIEVSCNDNEITDGAEIVVEESPETGRLDYFWNGRVIGSYSEPITKVQALVACYKSADQQTWRTGDALECVWNEKVIKRIEDSGKG